jgi:hypothetical protein
VLGQVGHDGRPHPDGRRLDRVLVLVVAVDGQQRAVVGPAPDDEGLPTGHDLVVGVGQAAG